MYGCRADLGMVFWGSYTQGETGVGSRKSEVGRWFKGLKVVTLRTGVVNLRTGVPIERTGVLIERTGVVKLRRGVVTLRTGVVTLRTGVVGIIQKVCK